MRDAFQEVIHILYPLLRELSHPVPVIRYDKLLELFLFYAMNSNTNVLKK